MVFVLATLVRQRGLHAMNAFEDEMIQSWCNIYLLDIVLGGEFLVFLGYQIH